MEDKAFREQLREKMMGAAESAAETGCENPYPYIVGWLTGECRLTAEDEDRFYELIHAAYEKARGGS